MFRDPRETTVPSPARRATGGGEAAEQAGFTLIGLMVAIAIINIGLGVAVTSWVTINQRAQEAELIWRGQQYMRALQCHRQQTGGLPDDLDELLDSDCIRALYPDPMSRDGQWRLIRETDLQREGDVGGSTGSRPGGVNVSVNIQTGSPEISVDIPGGSGSRGAAAGQGAPTDSLQAAYERLRTLSRRLDENFSRSSGNGIVGVVSTSTAESLRLYQGEVTYDAWRFVVQ